MPGLAPASVVGDLQSLQWLILGLLVFVLALIYRPQISAVIERLNGFRVQHRETTMEGTLDREPRTARSPQIDGPASQDPPVADPDASFLADDIDETAAGADGARGSEASESDSGAVRVRMLAALGSRNQREARALFDRLQTLEADPLARKLNQGTWLYMSFVSGLEPQALKQLDALASDSSVAAQMQILRGLGHEWLGDFQAAIAAYSAARDSAQDEQQRFRATGHLAEALDKTGEHRRAIEILEAALRESTNSRHRGQLWQSLASVHESHDAHELRALALQRAGDHSPDSTSLRFNAAYAYSAADHAKFAAATAHHYQTVLRLDPEHHSARNNLGVAFERDGLDILSIGEYRRASQGGNTLATANIAYGYLNAGFADEAEELVTEAAQDDSPHPNVGEAMAAISRAREKQSESREKLMTAGLRQAAFLGEYAEARLRSCPPSDDKWRLPGNVRMALSWRDGKLEAEWTVRRTRWKATGRAYGSSAQLSFQEMEYWGSDRSELGFQRRFDSYAYLSPDGQVLELMDLKDDGPVFRTALRIVDDDQTEPAQTRRDAGHRS